MEASSDFFVFRRFGQLNSPVLLRMQNQIEEIEEHLAVLNTGA